VSFISSIQFCYSVDCVVCVLVTIFFWCCSGTAENTKQAHHYISQLAKHKNIRDILPQNVLKKFSLDASTSQFSIASSLDSFDIDSLAPPASPGMCLCMHAFVVCMHTCARVCVCACLILLPIVLCS